MNEFDKELIRRAKRGDIEAFTLIVKNYKTYVFQTALGILADRMEAEDVTQDTFVKAFKGLAKLRDVETFPSWLATIATRRAYDAAKEKQKQMSHIEDLDASTVNSTQEHYTGVENRMVLKSLLAGLTPEERTIFVLRELEDKNYQEIADILNIPIGTVRSRLFNARKHIRQLARADEGRNEL